MHPLEISHNPHSDKLFLVATGTWHINGQRFQSFQLLENFFVSHDFQHDICLQDVQLFVSWLWIFCEWYAEILWPEWSILLLLTSAVESDICKESNTIVTMHFSHQVYAKLLFIDATSVLWNLLFTLHTILDSVTKGQKYVAVGQH